MTDSPPTPPKGVPGGDQVAADIAAWDAIGEHRTGTAGDRLAADWLADNVRDAGVTPRRDDFRLSRWVLRRCEIEVDGTTIEGVPLFDGGTTGPEGLVGRLRPLANGRAMVDGGGSPVIGLGALGPGAGVDANRAFADARREDKLAALVAVASISPEVPGLALQNADHFRVPFGPPALQVATGHEARLQAAAEKAEEIRLTTDVAFEPALGCNVHARIAGNRSTLAPFVVVTPKSSWWVSTAERGGGIAVWLALLRHFAAHRPARDVIFIATSGHELGHLGLEHYLATNPAPDAHAWLHLGANFAATGSGVRIQASDADSLEAIRTALDDVGCEPAGANPVGVRPGGEARNVHDLGEPYLSILGSNPWFHHPDDRWPDTVDLDRTRRIAEALRRLAHRLTS